MQKNTGKVLFICPLIGGGGEGIFFLILIFKLKTLITFCYNIVSNSNIEFNFSSFLALDRQYIFNFLYNLYYNYYISLNIYFIYFNGH